MSHFYVCIDLFKKYKTSGIRQKKGVAEKSKLVVLKLFTLSVYYCSICFSNLKKIQTGKTKNFRIATSKNYCLRFASILKVACGTNFNRSF